ncbi:uncharacterized protein LOC105663484 isoform X2 [Megachile rotundata]|uniref:uncharacterized protein LOC105663484 isoform X2 n=1 Tax=Megachile rotundata TaxID=143995 RepID=UPI003FD6042A
MVVQQIAVLSLLIIQVISAPTGCIESCDTYFKQYETSGHFNDHGLQTASQLQGPEFSKPGTWTEHNDYNVDNGHGKVHEERGQYVAGPKTVRYYKKNYSSSYSTKYGGGLSDVEQQNSNYRQGIPVFNIMQSNSGRIYDQVAHSELSAQQERYNTMHSQQRLQSTIRSGVQSERLEDFGEHIGDSQVLQHGLSNSNTQHSQVPYYPDTQPGNWSKVDSYKTDGGHGRVYTVEGQYVTGPKRVRYYTKNYTSSYSSHGGIPDTVGVGVEDIQKEIDKLHREIGVQTVGSSDTANINRYDQSILQNVNSNRYGNRNNYESSSSLIHNEQQLRQPASERVIIRNPSQSSYETNSHSTYEKHEGHAAVIQPVRQLIIPTPGYTPVLNTGSSTHSRNVFNTATSQQQTDNMQEAEYLNTHQSGLDQSRMFSDHLGQSGYNQNSAIQSGTGQSAHHKEHWSHTSHTKETSVPQYSTGISHSSGHNMQHSSNQYDSLHGTHQTLQQDNYFNKETKFNSGHQTHLGKLVSGVLDLGTAGDTVDCAYGSQYDHHSSQYQMKYKRGIKDDQEEDDTFQQHTQQSYQPWKPGSTNEHLEDLTQQTNQEEDLTQQTSGKLEFGQTTQQSYQPWRQHSANQQYEDYTQQVSAHDDLTQQTSGKLEFGQDSQQTYQPWKLDSASQHSVDLTQQTSKYDDFTQQTSGKLEVDQESQQSYQPQWPGRNKNSEDYTQQVGAHDDFTQQTSGKLELEQQSHQIWKPDSANKQEDHDDLTQQTSGKLEFGQQSHQPWKPSSANQEVDDLSQQTTGKLEFGQHSSRPSKLTNADQVDDLTQQTSDHDDLTQQTSEKLEFGQHSSRPWRLTNADQVDDLTQQTSDHDDLTQQTSGKLEFGQQSHQPWKLSSANQEVDDLTQQTTGKLEFGQHSSRPSKLTNADQVDDLTQQTSDHDDLTQQTSDHDDLTQQTSDHDDLTQQTSGKLEFGQHSYQPWKPSSANQEVDDLSQQTTGKLEFGQHSSRPSKLTNADQVDDLTQQTSDHDDLTQQTSDHDDLTQQTSDHDDLTQQTSGKLEFGQHSYQPWKPSSANQEVDDLSQQTTGKLEFGQHSSRPSKLTNADQVDDLTQQTSDHDDLTQQTSEKLEFGQHSYQPWKPSSANQEVGDLTQQTHDHDDLTQQTSGKLEFGQHSSQLWKLTNVDQVDDLTQQTGSHDDFTQQTSGKLQFGQHSYQPWKPSSANQEVDDLTQQTRGHDDLTQQTSGKLEFGQESQHSYHVWQPDNAGQYSEDLTQQTGMSDDFTQQSGKLEFGQQSQVDVHQIDQGSTSHIPKPAGKPKPRSRYSRVGSVESDGSNVRNLEMRGDQAVQNSNKNNSGNLNQQSAINAYNIEGENGDQVNWLHKSNDATVGLQWHYTYHPSDQRQFVQQTDRKDKENLQQQMSQIKFSDLQQTREQEESQDVRLMDNVYQQSSNQYNEASHPYVQSQTYASGQTTKFDEDSQQTSDIMNEQKHIRSSIGEHQLEPRILEAYGGGPYDGSHNGDIYHGVTLSPSATLPPIIGADPWDIREKPSETTPPPMPVEPLITDYPTEESTPPPSFWSKLGYKITNTFGKAKEKARNIFG